MTACTSFLVFFGSKCLQKGEGPKGWSAEHTKCAGTEHRASEAQGGAKRKNIFPPRLLAVEAREAVRRQAIGKSRWQTAGLSTIKSAAANRAAAPRALTKYRKNEA